MTEKKGHTDKTIVVSLGGSLVYPLRGIDTAFVRRFVKTIEQLTDEGFRFAPVVGGGSITRQYHAAMRKVKKEISMDDQDWMGIAMTRVNAHFLRLLFGARAFRDIVVDPNTVTPRLFRRTPIVCAGGERPGQTTDTVAATLALALKATRVVNLSNVEHIYDKDPKQKNATPFCHLTWKEFRVLLPKQHAAGAHTPFDPIAATLAEKHNLQLIVAGASTSNFARICKGQVFHGTVVMG